MTPERWARVQEVFGAALALGPEARVSYVERECSGDAELRREVESLLASHEEVSSAFLEPRTLATPRTLARLSGERRSVAPGARLGPYEIVEMLGSGGMGEVYRARDLRLDRDVAVKVLPPSLAGDLSALERFEREAKAVAALSHPNILSIFDFGREGETAYAVTELLEGETLRARMKAGPIGVDELLGLGSQTLGGLGAAHAKGIVHRDLKPENVFVTKDGRVKILDFGLARRGAASAAPAEVARASPATQQTMPGTVMGTLGYMSPEQLLGRTVDQRADLFSVGVILYEMAAGRAPFRGDTGGAVADAILRSEPPPLEATEVPGKLGLVIGKLLAKEPGQRYGTAEEVLEELAPLMEARRPRMSWPARIALVTAAVAVIAFGAWFWRRTSRERWVHAVATPEVARLVDAGDNLKATALLRRARAIIPSDPTLEKLWQKATADLTLDTEPHGAHVLIRPYPGDPNPWESVGTTPIQKVRLPNSAVAMRVVKTGYAPIEWLGGPGGPMTIKLVPQASVPAGMVVVWTAGVETGLTYPLVDAPAVVLPDFLIDQNEVTNEAYAKFVEAGAYRRPEFWKQPFTKDGRSVSWDEAMRSFVDSTGRPGPSTWEAGRFRSGLDRHPVAGVSWYEAAAYAEFAGKTLPTVYHWMNAAQTDTSRLVVPGSNFGGRGTRPVGAPGSLSGSGTNDMAGNVKEWCWNEGSEGKRFILGGGFGEPGYQFVNMDAQSPWDRRANVGFRCMKLAAEPAPQASAKLEPVAHDFLKEPVSDEVFEAYRELYKYDRDELDAKTEGTQGAEDWIREKVTFNAAYGNERVTLYLYLPRRGKPPYQTVVYYPGAYAYQLEKFDDAESSQYPGVWNFLPGSGRAFAYPVYRGTFERTDRLGYSGRPVGKVRDRLIMQSKDLGRTLDYLETRGDIDSQKFAYLGFSTGGSMSPLMLANEPRFRVAVLSSSGFSVRPFLPEVDQINFVRHVTIPVLMLNSRYDYTFPVEASQQPLFQLLGTPVKDKRHVVYDTGHADLPHKEEVRETLEWLDKYLGPVKR